MAARRPSEPLIPTVTKQKQSSCTVEPTNYSDPQNQKIAIPASDLTFSSASSPVQRKKKFRLPKIVLQDKRRPDSEVKSCLEIDPKIPQDDVKIHDDDLQCCPPCDLQDGKGSKYIVERSDWTPFLKAEPGDLACFLAGCPPDVAMCEKHHRKGGGGEVLDNSKDRSNREDFRRATPEIAKGPATRKDSSLIVKLKANEVDNRGNDGYISNFRSSSMSPSVEDSASVGPISESDDRIKKQMRMPTDTKIAPNFGQESSVTSGSDTFPHASKSMEIATGKIEPMSTSVVTNFALAGVKPKTKYSAAKETARKRRSEARSQGNVDVPEPLHIDPTKGSRAGSVTRAREGIKRRSKSEGPPSTQQSYLENGRAWGNTASNELLVNSLNQPVFKTEELVPGGGRTEKSQTALASRLRSVKDDSRSTQARETLTSNASRTDDTAPTEFSERTRNSRIAPAEAANNSMSPMSPKAKALSFVSSRSRALVPKHDLLKPSITASQPLDIVLPLPPVLTPAPVKPQLVKPEDPKFSETLRIISDRDKEKALAHQSDVSYPVSNPGLVLMDNKPRTTSDPDESYSKPQNVDSSQQSIVLDNSLQARIDGVPSTIVPTAKKLLATAVESTIEGASQSGRYLISPAAQESLNAAYWGFVPAIREAVQDIVEVAVRNAVNEAAFTAAGKKESIPEPDSQQELNILNTKTQGTTAQEMPPSSQRESESTVVRTLQVLSPDVCGRNRLEQSPIEVPSSQRDNSILQGSSRDSITSKGQENENNQNPLNLTSVDANVGYDQLETVPLDDFKSSPDDKRSLPSQTGGKSGTAVPPRRSSKNKAVLVLRNKTPLNSEVNMTPRTSVAPDVSPDRQKIRVSRTFRSISSAGSVSGLRGDDKEAKAPLIEAIDDETIYPMNKLSRATTVHWVKELLSNNSLYEPQFTALPSRMQKDKNKAASKPKNKDGEKYVNTADGDFKALPVRPVVARPRTAASKHDKKAEGSEAFTQTINDLESLMNEALKIARQAADTRDAPNSLGDAAKILRGDRVRSEEELRARYQVKPRRDDRESFPSIHESLVSYSDSEASDMTIDSDFRYPRPPTPPVVERSLAFKSEALVGKEQFECAESVKAKAISLQGSQPPSSNIRNGNEQKNINPIKAADPRSMPLESQINTRPANPPFVPVGDRNLSIVIKPRSSSKRDREVEIREELSDSEVIEPAPEFRTPEFSRGRSTTSKTLESERSPRRLSPAKKGVSLDKRASQGPSGGVGITQEGEADPPLEGSSVPLPQLTPPNIEVKYDDKGLSEEDYRNVATRLASKSVPGKRQVRDYILQNRRPPIQERDSSRNLKKLAKANQEEPRVLTGQTAKTEMTGKTYNWQNIDESQVDPCPEDDLKIPSPYEEKKQPKHAPSYDGSNFSHEMDFNTGYGVRQRSGGIDGAKGQTGYELRDVPDSNLPQTSKLEAQKPHPFNLKGLNHMSLKDHHLKGFSLARSHKKQKIARDWSPARKRFVAFVSCLSTSLIGLLVGIYAGETPSIQYYIVDLHHYTVLGNVFFFIALSIPTFFFWPLPLLHGRKPYILGSMSLAMPLLFPQALAVGQVRSPYVATWRVALILPRTAMGFCLGFANMNFKSMLTDVFGASLQSSNPHQEHADEFDVRRHGGGMGIWLGLWTWSALGSIGVGFMIGALIINHLSPAWGFYISITIIAFVMLLNVLVPETRRSAYRRSVAEVPNPNGDVSRRLARGEVKMHMVQTGPRWWGEEFHYGVTLTMKMLRQPGFMVMAIYVSWIYGQMVLIILLLGALMSRDYKFTSPEVAASATAIPLGALFAIPFQKASIFSRARSKSAVSDDATLSHKKVHWSSHMVRRSVFILVLPFAGLGFTLSSSGPPIPFIIPILFAGLVGFLSNLAMAECHGILMETFDTSDLQPGMTGRARGSSGNKKEAKRTNYSSFPRVQSAFAITQGFGYLIASVATGVGGAMTRHIGAQAATGVMSGILLILSLMLLGVLVRFTTVQIVPNSKVAEMEQYHNARRMSRTRQEEGISEEEPFRPIIIGNPHHHTRRMCLLELGGLSRFSEIRIKNKLVDSNSLEAKHPNRAAFMDFEKRIKEKEEELVRNVRRSLSRNSSRGSRRSDGPAEPGDLGGFRDMGVDLTRNRSGNMRGSRRDQLRREGSKTRKEISD